jgi:hypothetical protein
LSVTCIKRGFRHKLANRGTVLAEVSPEKNDLAFIVGVFYRVSMLHDLMLGSWKLVARMSDLSERLQSSDMTMIPWGWPSTRQDIYASRPANLALCNRDVSGDGDLVFASTISAQVSPFPSSCSCSSTLCTYRRVSRTHIRGSLSFLERESGSRNGSHIASAERRSITRRLTR